jgi:hypothetical protein
MRLSLKPLPVSANYDFLVKILIVFLSKKFVEIK